KKVSGLTRRLSDLRNLHHREDSQKKPAFQPNQTNAMLIDLKFRRPELACLSNSWLIYYNQKTGRLA
ncbi:hypothetical protein KB219_34995, partial [Pseudomonas aeruginosa]|nr:hypothetical protein [Pseudomonas aeruginosa]